MLFHSKNRTRREEKRLRRMAPFSPAQIDLVADRSGRHRRGGGSQGDDKRAGSHSNCADATHGSAFLYLSFSV
jgi:hypothetical protein